VHLDDTLDRHPRRRRHIVEVGAVVHHVDLDDRPFDAPRGIPRDQQRLEGGAVDVVELDEHGARRRHDLDDARQVGGAQGVVHREDVGERFVLRQDGPRTAWQQPHPVNGRNS
jgi:hypothetical protein